MGQKISQLTALSTTYADTDLLEVSVDTGGGTFVTRKMTFLQLRTAFTKLQANLDMNSFQITSASNGNIIIRPNGSGAVLVGGNSSQATELRFMEDSDNGTNYVALKVANALAASTTYTLPTADGTTGQVLSTNGSGVLSWATASGGGGITVGTTAVTSGTVGRIFFQGTGDVVQQDSTLFWDNTNKRLGVGATPSTSVRLDVRAQGALSTDVALRVRNSADTRDFLVVNGAGDVFNRGAGGVSTNTFFGENSGRSATGGTNTFFGANAGESNTTAIQNTFIGEQAGNKTTTGNSNTFVGRAAGFSNTTGILNCIFGRETGLFNTTGSSNSFFGSEAGFSNTTASANSFFGSDAGRANTTGFHNTFVGSESGKANTTASYNSFFGRGAGISNTTGQQNTFVGNNAAYANTTGSFNTAIGRENAANTTGSYNNFFGVGAGNLVSGGGNNTVTNNSIYIGYDTRANASSETNQIVIGHEAIGLGSNTAVLGNTSIVTTQLRGNVISGNQAALATTATDGFLYIPSCAGAPTGVPTAITGKVPMVADTTNNKLYIYVGGAWTAMN